MKELIAHLKKMLAEVGELKLGEEDAARKLGHCFLDRTKYPEDTLEELDAHFQKWGHTLQDGLQGFPLDNAAEILQQMRPLVNGILREVQQDTEWQGILSAKFGDEAIRNKMEREILIAILDNVVTPLVSKNTISRQCGQIIKSVFANQNLPLQEQLKAIQADLPPIKITPTVCYFKGKGSIRKGDFTHAGHVAIGVLTEDVPHEVIICDKPPPTTEEKSPDNYLKNLPINPHHNAFLIAGQGCGLVLKVLKEAKPPRTREDILKEIPALHSLYADDPILIKSGEELYIYGHLDGGINTSRPLLTLLSKTSEDFQTLNALPFKHSHMDDGAPELASVIKTIKKYHTPGSNVYYINRNGETSQCQRLRSIPACIEKERNALDNKPLAPHEKTRYLTPLDKSDVERILSDHFLPIPAFSRYLTYADGRSFSDIINGVPPIDCRVGVSTTQSFTSDKTTYTKKGVPDKEFFRLPLPPCDAEKIDEATQDFANKNMKDYKLHRNNCSTAVSDFMKKIGLLDISIKPIRPITCASHVCLIQMNHLEGSRQKTLTDKTLAPPQKVKRLLKLEIRFLEIKLQQDRINQVILKNSKKKRKKIRILKKLLDQFEKTRVLSPPYILAALENACSALYDKTAIKNDTRDHLMEWIARIKEDSSPAIHVRAGPSSLHSSSPRFYKPPSEPHSDTRSWLRSPSDPNIQYYYLNASRQEAKKTLQNALDTPVEKTSVKSVDKTPHLGKDQVRISTHSLPAYDLQFGLLEQCRLPEQELHSEILPPKKQLANLDWLLMIDRQIQESQALLRKESTSLTIRSLDESDLHLKTKPQSFEIAYMQYCLAMDLRCNVMDQRKGTDKEVTLDSGRLKSLLIKYGAQSDPAVLKEQIKRSRSHPEETTPPSISLS